MALAFVKEVASVAATNSTNPQVLTVPAAGVAAGNLLVIVGGFAAGGTITGITDTGGHTWTLNTVAQDDRNAANRVVLAYVVCTSGLVSGNTVSITSSITGFANRLYMLAEFSGNASASALDKTTSAPDSFPTANLMDSTATATTAQTDEVLVGCFAYNSTTNTITSYGSGYTGMTTLSAGLRVASAWQIVSATGAYNAQATQSGTAAVWGAGIATFKAAAAATSLAFTGPAQPHLIYLRKNV